MSDWLTAEEAAEPLRTTAHQVTKMAREGKQFTKVKWVGNRVRIHRSEIYPPQSSTQIAHLASDPAIQRLVTEIENRLAELKEVLTEEPPRSVTDWLRAVS